MRHKGERDTASQTGSNSERQMERDKDDDMRQIIADYDTSFCCTKNYRVLEENKSAQLTAKFVFVFQMA